MLLSACCRETGGECAMIGWMGGTMKQVKSSTKIRANKRKAKLKAKRRRQRARA